MTTSNKLLPVHKRFNISFSHGKGVYLFSEEKKYLDFGAGIAVNSVGHCHPKMIKAISNQAKKLWHVSNIYNGNELNKYAENLVAKTFADYVFFCNSGAESIECAIKMIRKHFYEKEKTGGEKNRNKIITFNGAFHGRTIATISAAGKKKYIEGFEPILDGFIHVDFNDIEAVKKAITKDVAGILIEPIQGEEGIKVADKKFIQELRKLADENGLLLALDEVQSGFGRTGFIYAYEYFGIKPDIVCTAKGIAGGFPLGACLATKEAASGMTIGVHGTTYGGNPLAMAVAEAALEIVGEEKFLKNVRKNGEFFKNELQNLQKKFPQIIDEVRGIGLMLGLKINEKILNSDLAAKLIENGLLVVPAGENVLRILPPLIIEEKDIKKGVKIFAKTFQKLK